jgi:hypothetical protein
MTTLTGSRQIWAFVWEDDGEYAQEPGDPSDSNFKAFGDDEDISEPDADNNPETYYRPFSRTPSEYHEMEFSGSWGCDFIYTNPYWLGFIFGTPNITDNTTDGNGYELAFEQKPEKPPKTAHLVEETHYEDGTVTQTVYIGAGVDSPDLSTSVQDTMDVSLDGFYADERTYDSAANSPYGEIGSQPEPTHSPLNFANAELYLDLSGSGSVEFKGRVQDLDVTFNSNAEADFELGTRFATGVSFLDFAPELSYTARVDAESNDAERKSFYGNQVDTTGSAVYPAEELSDADIKASVELFSRKETNDLTIDFAETFPSSYTRSNLGDPESAVDDDVDRNVTGLNVVANISEEPKI